MSSFVVGARHKGKQGDAQSLRETDGSDITALFQRRTILTDREFGMGILQPGWS